MKNPLLILCMLFLFVAAGCSDSKGWDNEDEWASSRQTDKRTQDDKERDERQRDRNERDQNDRDRDARDRNNFDRDLEESEQNLEDALSNLGNALEEMGKSLSEKAGVEPVDYRDLKEIVPERLAGLDRTNSNGERSGALGFRVSQIEQTFKDDSGDQRLEVTIVDMGGLKNLASVGLDWLDYEVDRESDDGYERTRTYRGHPVIDQCEDRGRYAKCDMTAFISRRFVITLESRGLEMGSLENVMEQLDIATLEEKAEEDEVEG